MFEVFNKYYFKNLADDYQLVWSLYEDGKSVQTSQPMDINVAPRQRMQVTLPYNQTLKKDAEYFVKVQFVLKDKMPWAAKDFVMAEEQIQVKAATDRPSISEVAIGSEELKSLVDPKTRNVQITGTGFEVNFDSQTGSIYNLTYGGEK